MRKQFCDALVARSQNPNMVFLTGDLGFMALEPLRDVMGARFINVGVAEQNMIGVAAGLARQGLEVWVYSIAPFCYARPFEQIRNDIAFHGLPVRLVGNGGGYGYGVMGPTHHAIEDYGVLLTLPGMSVSVPIFDEDVPAAVELAARARGPLYFRLGRGEPPKGYDVPPYAPWRQLTFGHGPSVIAVGPLASTYIEAFEGLPESNRPNLWAVAQLPLEQNPPPAQLMDAITSSAALCIAEEHVQHGGFGSELAQYLLIHGVTPKQYFHHFARAHHFERYGSQAYLRKLSGLDPESLLATINRVEAAV